MKKILFLINTLNGGGAEKVVVDTVNNLVSDNLDITVQTVLDSGIYKSKLDERVNYKTILCVKSKKLLNMLISLITKLLPEKLIYKVFVKNNYDYEIAFLEGLPTKIISGSTNKKSKKIAWVHTDLIANPSSFLVFGSEEKEKEAYSKFDCIFCVSEDTKKAFIKKYGFFKENIEVIHNILDDDAIIQKGMENVEYPTDIIPRFISVGRLTHQKGYDILLKIHKRLTDEGLMHSLTILGEGDMREQLQKFVTENELSDTVKLLGFQDNPYKFIKNSDLFVYSSRAEGYSIVVTEACILGTPVVSTNVAGTNEKIGAMRCNMVVENNEEALYNALKQILLNKGILEKYKHEQKEKRKYFRKKYILMQLKKIRIGRLIFVKSLLIVRMKQSV